MVSGQVQIPVRLELREDMTAPQPIELAGGPRYWRRPPKPEAKLLGLRNITPTGERERDMPLASARFYLS
jgi:hypothetical protein